MAARDQASDLEAKLFELKSLKLRREFELYKLPTLLWELLEEIQEKLGAMTAHCSYGNGEIVLALSSEEREYFYWSQPERVDYYLIYFTRKYLNAELSAPFPRNKDLVYWYEMID